MRHLIWTRAFATAIVLTACTDRTAQPAASTSGTATTATGGQGSNDETSAAPPCQSDDDCAPCDYCIDGTCHVGSPHPCLDVAGPGCRSDAECGPEAICKGGCVLTEACSSTRDCDEERPCFEGFCRLISCEASTECGEGICIQGACVDVETVPDCTRSAAWTASHLNLGAPTLELAILPRDDELNDLVVLSSDGSIRHLEAVGDGTVSMIEHPTGMRAAATLTVHDVDGDGLDDVVVAAGDGVDELVWLRRGGTGDLEVPGPLAPMGPATDLHELRFFNDPALVHLGVAPEFQITVRPSNGGIESKIALDGSFHQLTGGGLGVSNDDLWVAVGPEQISTGDRFYSLKSLAIASPYTFVRAAPRPPTDAPGELYTLARSSPESRPPNPASLLIGWSPSDPARFEGLRLTAALEGVAMDVAAADLDQAGEADPVVATSEGLLLLPGPSHEERCLEVVPTSTTPRRLTAALLDGSGSPALVFADDDEGLTILTR